MTSYLDHLRPLIISVGGVLLLCHLASCARNNQLAQDRVNTALRFHKVYEGNRIHHRNVKRELKVNVPLPMPEDWDMAWPGEVIVPLEGSYRPAIEVDQELRVKTSKVFPARTKKIETRPPDYFQLASRKIDNKEEPGGLRLADIFALAAILLALFSLAAFLLVMVWGMASLIWLPPVLAVWGLVLSILGVDSEKFKWLAVAGVVITVLILIAYLFILFWLILFWIFRPSP